MAVIEIRTEPSGRTRMLFDFRAVAPGCDDVGPHRGCDDPIIRRRLSGAVTNLRSPRRGKSQAASDLSTSLPVTLPSRRRISAS